MKLVCGISCLLIMLLTMITEPFADQAADAAVAGDAKRGAALFSGSLPFAKGAAPCGACHALTNRGVNGGKMAGDLGDLFTPDGADVIKDAIVAIEAPAMKKMYTAHPLSDQEYADLTAFARQPLPEHQPAPGRSLPLAGLGAVGLFLIGFALYKRRIS
ncbi:hypothetical protein [Trichlorobacter sp.]|jgi:mono/diheme cytochrome c family protein|uniref:c-type cytochrome n=1 Tax=Trichlorobacter sp. TaxID=2911007 RepID=UPI002A369C8A|nr:hypothetical protein [Trichlorobacter sp.]MDY0384906.1 hypothetical protein [Trichlorobacter sp.]